MQMFSKTESAVRARAKARGYVMYKSRQRSIHANNLGEFMLADDRNRVVMGADYDATLDEIAAYLTDQ